MTRDLYKDGHGFRDIPVSRPTTPFTLVWNQVGRDEWQAGSERSLYKIIKADGERFFVELWSCGFRIRCIAIESTLIWAKEKARDDFKLHGGAPADSGVPK